MPKISDIIKKSEEIKQVAEFWGFDNPRLFKGLVPDEENNLFILVKKQSNQASIHLLEIALNQMLPCPAYISEEDQLNVKYKNYILENAVNLSDEESLSRLFKDIIFYEKPNLTEEELRDQDYQLHIFNLVKEDREKKRKILKEISSTSQQRFFKDEKRIKLEEEFSKLMKSGENDKNKDEQVGQLSLMTLISGTELSKK